MSAGAASSAAPAPAAAAATRADAGGAHGRLVETVTPEGVPLLFQVASAGHRAAALLLDAIFVSLLLLGLLLVVVVLVLAVGGDAGQGLAILVLLLGLFFLRFGYFAAFELGSRGATPGKRLVGLRVVDRSGGPLSAEAVIVRNLAREIELFVPLAALAVPDAAGFSGPPLVQLFASLWIVALALVPMFNRRRLRVGDLLGGTMVVVVPQAALLADVGRRGSESAAAVARFAFSEAQLDVYGEYELRVLEDVLRRGANAQTPREALGAVAERIARRIGWTAPVARRDAPAFLRAYYAALRARLEHRMLLGRRKADKHAR